MALCEIGLLLNYLPAEEKPMAIGRSHALGQFDRTLYLLKLESLAGDLHRKTQAATVRVGLEQRRIGQGEGVGFYAKLVDAHLEVLGEYLEDVDRICREVWHVQGGILSPDFIRQVIRDHAVFTAIAARCGAIQGEISLTAQRQRFGNLTPVLRHLAMERKRLESNWSNRYEIEARELELREKQAISPASSETDPLSISYATLSTGRLQQLLQETEDSIDYLKDKFPDWRAWGSGYGPGNKLPDFFVQIGRLEKNREEIILALSKRVDKETPIRSTVVASEPTPSWDGPAQKTGSRIKSARRNPDVAKRRTVVNSNPGVSAGEMCDIFDRQDVLLPPEWKRAGFETWRKAYRDPSYRPRIHVLITKDRASSGFL